MKKTSKFLLNQVKSRAYQLRKDYQLPFKLVYLIEQLNSNTDIRIVEFLLNQSKHLLRMKGYYKQYPSIERLCNETLTKEFEQFKDSIAD